MVPLQYSHHKQPNPMPPHLNTSLPRTLVSNSSYRNGSHDMHRMRQHPEHLEHARAQAQAQADQDHHEGRPVVWRWVPFPANSTGYLSQPTALPASTSTPRVIYATSKRIENNEPEDLTHVLTGGELRLAREVLIRNNVGSSPASATEPSTSALCIPEVPATIPPHINLVSPHVNLARQSLMHNPERVSAGSHHVQDGGVSTAITSDGPGGDLEVANLLLNMGGSSTNDERSSAKKKQLTSSNKSSFENRSPSGSNNQPSKSAAAAKTTALQDSCLDNWVGGSVSLHTPEDDDVLSPLHCFMRRYCVEAFSATAEDVATPRYGKSHGFKVEVGQVGIRCLHCKGCSPGERAERAVCYPSSLRNIYHSIETWQRRHSLVCKRITPWVRKSILALMESSKTRAGGRRQYWEDSARRLGMVDTSRGVRFSRPPGDLGPIASLGSGCSPGALELPQHKPQQVVREDDRDLVTSYLFLLMEQMQTCHFTEEDRSGGRSKIKDNHVGFPGMECRHCQGRAGFGRYFPSSVAALSLANSDRNVYNHLQKCRRCPDAIKTELVRLQSHQSQAKNRRGLRKLFFNRIWTRMHVEDDAKGKKEGENNFPPVVVATNLKPSSEYVPYTGIISPAMIGHSYHHSIHPQVTVNNFHRY